MAAAVLRFFGTFLGRHFRVIWAKAPHFSTSIWLDCGIKGGRFGVLF
jgi:hypothetical protein